MKNFKTLGTKILTYQVGLGVAEGRDCVWFGLGEEVDLVDELKSVRTPDVHHFFIPCDVGPSTQWIQNSICLVWKNDKSMLATLTLSSYSKWCRGPIAFHASCMSTKSLGRTDACWPELPMRQTAPTTKPGAVTVLLSPSSGIYPLFRSEWGFAGSSEACS